MKAASNWNIIIFCSNELPLKEDFFSELDKKFGNIQVVALGKDACPAHIPKIICETKVDKTNALNEAVSRCSSGFVLYTEGNECFDIEELAKFTPENNKVYPAAIQISNEDNPVEHTHFQIRIFPADKNLNFTGSAIPTLAPAVADQDIVVSPLFFPISKHGLLYKGIDLDAELKKHPNIAEYWLMSGLQLTAKNQYKTAEKKFKTALQKGKMPLFNTVASINGMADSLLGQSKWEECISVANHSIEKEAHQRMPYLLLFKAYYARNEWEEAYTHLFNYLENLAGGSLINYDILFPLTQTHFLLADTAYKQGWHERAFVHYEQFYELKDGAIDNDILERLVLYSLELDEKENSKKYFSTLYADKIPDKLREDEKIKVLELLSIFVDKEWFQTPLEVFEKLFNYNPKDAEILRKWVATLIKAKKIEKAQELINKHKTTFS